MTLFNIEGLDFYVRGYEAGSSFAGSALGCTREGTLYCTYHGKVRGTNPSHGTGPGNPRNICVAGGLGLDGLEDFSVLPKDRVIAKFGERSVTRGPSYERNMVVIQTVSLKRASEGSRKWFIVECRAVDGNNNSNGNRMRRSKRFLCQGFEDADAKAKALRFAFSTEGFGAFRRFLFGNREEGGSSDSSASAASLTGSGPGDCRRRRRRPRLRGNMAVCVRANGLNGLRFAAAVCVASNGLIRSVSFRGGEGNEAGMNGVEEAIQRAVDFLKGAAGSRGRAKIHQAEVSSFEGSSEMACRCCGQQQQRRGSRDANFGKQNSEDNVCSACLKMEREEIVVIRIDEQGEYSVTSLKDVWVDSKSAEGTTEEPVCCVCGCEDNEDFEQMIHPCTCNGGSVLAHPGCIYASMATSKIWSKQAATSCKVCGGSGGLINGGQGLGNQTVTGAAEDGSSRPTHPNWSLRKNVKDTNPKGRVVKRPRSSLTSGVTVGEKRSPLRLSKDECGWQAVQGRQKEDTPVSESEKLGVTVLGRRFNDAIASVPIKKRRIALVRSPSPPPRSPSPGNLDSETFSKTVFAVEHCPAKLNTQGQQVLGDMDTIQKCRHEDSEKMNVEIEGTESLLDISTEEGLGGADFSGISILAAAACTGNHGNGANNLEDVANRAQSPASEGSKSLSLSLKDDMEIDSAENQQEVRPVMEPQIQEEACNDQSDMHKSAKPPSFEDIEQVNEGEQTCFDRETEGHITTDMVCQSTELALGSNISRGSGVYFEATEVNATASSVRLLRDREKEEKGMLLRLDSGYLRDDRSHWDLNTVMDAWENPPENLNTDPGPNFSCEVPVGNDNEKNKSYSDGIPVQILASESKSDTREMELDMVSKVSDTDQGSYNLNSSDSPLKFENHDDSKISLSLQLDTIFSKPGTNQELMNRDSSGKNTAPLEDLDVGKSLNLSIAPSKDFSVSEKYGTFPEGEINVQSVESLPSVISVIQHVLQGDKHLDILIPQGDASRAPRHVLEHPKEHVDVVDRIVTEENDSGHKTEFVCALQQDSMAVGEIDTQENDVDPESTDDNVDNELKNGDSIDNTLKYSVSSPIHDEHSVEAVNAPILVNNASIAADETICKVDVNAELSEVVCKGDAAVVVGENDYKVVETVAAESDDKVRTIAAVVDGACKGDDPVAVDESVNKVDNHVAVDEDVCNIDISMEVNEDVPMVADEFAHKINSPVAADESVYKVDAHVAVNEVDDLVQGDDPECEIKAPVRVEESICKVEALIATNQSVCRVDSPVAVDESTCNVNAAMGVVDTCILGEKSKSLEDRLEKHSVEMVTEVAYDGDYDYDAYDEDDEPVSDSEKIMEEQDDADSQYEDGECRETMPCEWNEDVAEELEAEHVDYGYSDCRDADDIGAGADERFSMSLQAESVHKGEEPIETEDMEHDRNWDDAQQAEMEEKGIEIHRALCDSQFGDSTRLGLAEQGNGMANEMGAEGTNMGGLSVKIDCKSELKSVKPSGENKERVMEAGQPCALDQHKAIETRETKHTAASRQKFSGWDQLPEGFANAEEALKSVRDNTAKWGRGLGWTALTSRDSLGRMGPSAARGLSSRMERGRPGDSVRGRDGGFQQGSRDESLDTSPHFTSRGRGRGRTIGRGGSLRGMHNRARDDPWMDSSSGQWGGGRHHSPGYYGSPVGFGPPGPTNAAAVAAAKVESSGFVVAPDGTIVKAGGAGPASRGGMRPVMGVGRGGRGTMMGRGSSADMEGSINFGTQMGMGPARGPNTNVSPETARGRTGVFAPDIVGPARRGGTERYGGPLYGNSRMDPSVVDAHRRPVRLADHRLLRRDRSFSPPLRRGSPHRTSRSHTKSPSRSITRSPRLWLSPRGRTSCGMEGRSGSRCSRSPPSFMSEARVERLKSPLSHRLGIPGHAMGLLSSSGSRCSPPQASRWASERRDVGRIRDHDYKRPFVTTRSPSGRMCPRGVHRSPLMDSTGGSKHSSECFRPMHSGRSEFGSDNRRSRREDIDDGRWKHNDRYTAMYSSRPIEVGSDMRRLRHEEEYGFKGRRSRVEDVSELQGRRSPRTVDKDRDNRAGSTSQRDRIREEDKGRLKYSRDGRPRGGFKSSGAREGDDDVAPRRRRPS